MKKIFLLLFASVLVFSCTKDVEVADSTADLSATLAQYDDTNMGIYKGVFTTQGTMERGTLEVNLLPGNYGVATLRLSTGQEINFKADRKVEAGDQVQGLQFNSSSVMASFKLSADMDGNNVEITDVVYKGITSGAIAAHETSRSPVVPISGVLSCDDCAAHPLLVTGATGTFSLLYTGDGSADDTLSSLADVGVIVSTGGSQSGCVDGGAQTTCDISGGGTIGGNTIAWVGTHTYNNADACSEAGGTWSLDSTNHGVFTGTFVSDVTCVPPPPANDTCATADAAVCGGSYSGSTVTATDDDGLYGPDVWYSLTGLTAGDEVTVSLCGGGTDYDSRLVIYDACGGTELFNLDDSCGLQSEIIYITDGSDVLVSVQAFSTGTGNYGLDITCAAAPTCMDGIQNGDETGIDCGGATCPACPVVPFDCGSMGWQDDGGGADYSLAQDVTETLDAGAGNVASVSFSEFQLENDWDHIAFYDGADATAPEITVSDLGAVAVPSTNNGAPGFTDAQLLGDSVTSTGQFLTYVFHSDTAVTNPGWTGDITCGPAGPTGPNNDNTRTITVKKYATPLTNEERAVGKALRAKQK